MMRVKINYESGTMLVVVNDDDIIELKNGHIYAINDYPFDGNITSTLKLSDISRLVIKKESKK